jgi:hypothetical protein
MIYFKPLQRQGVPYLVRVVMKCIIYVTPNGTMYESERAWTEVVVTCFRANYLSIYTVKLISMKNLGRDVQTVGGYESERPEKGGLQRRQQVIDGDSNSMHGRDTNCSSPCRVRTVCGPTPIGYPLWVSKSRLPRCGTQRQYTWILYKVKECADLKHHSSWYLTRSPSTSTKNYLHARTHAESRNPNNRKLYALAKKV